MTAAAGTRPLGRVCPGTGLRGRLTYLPGRGAIVVPECIMGGEWRCGVIARASTRIDMHLTASVNELTTEGCTELAIDPIQLPELYSMAWQAGVFARWPWTAVANLARCMVEQLQLPETRLIPIHAAAMRRLATATHLFPVVIRHYLDRLREAGYLTPDRTGQDMTLTLP